MPDSRVSGRIALALQALKESRDNESIRIVPNRGAILVFEFDKLPPTLNQMLRMNRWKRDELLEAWSWWTYEQAYNELMLTPAPRIASVSITLVLKVYRLMDWDNASARLKIPGDALVNSAVILNDSPKVVKNYTVRQSQVSVRDQGISIILEVL